MSIKNKIYSFTYFFNALCTLFLIGCSSISEDSIKQTSNNPILKALYNGKIKLIAPSFCLDKEHKVELYSIIPWIEPFVKKASTLQQMDTGPEANPIEIGQELLIKALKDPQANILWSLRGGDGSVYLLPALFKQSHLLHPKTIIGFSDSTALHLYVSQKWGWKSIHGPMLIEVVKNRDPKNLELLQKMISCRQVFHYKNIHAVTSIVGEKINGLLTGGHLSLITRSLGTEWQIDMKNKIVLIEHNPSDQSTLYEMNRLINSGLLNEAKAILLGNLENTAEDYDIVLKELSSRITVPIFTTDFFGHGYKNYPWIYNSNAQLNKLKEGDWELSFSNEGLPLLK